MSHETSATRDSQRPSAFSKGWLRQFLAGLPLTAGGVAAALWVYAVWGALAVTGPARAALDRGDDAGLIEAVELLADSHLFAGYETYHGFGPKSAAPTYADVRSLLARKTPYSPAETRWLIRNVAYFVPAFLELKSSGFAPVVPGDREVAETLWMRWDNALVSNRLLALHFTLVTLLLGVVWYVYRRFNLYEKIS